MDDGFRKKHYKLKCHISLWEVLGLSLVCAVIIVITFGIALPICIFEIGRKLINKTTLEEIDSKTPKDKLQNYLDEYLHENANKNSLEQ